VDRRAREPAHPPPLGEGAEDEEPASGSGDETHDEEVHEEALGRSVGQAERAEQAARQPVGREVAEAQPDREDLPPEIERNRRDGAQRDLQEDRADGRRRDRAALVGLGGVEQGREPPWLSASSPRGLAVAAGRIGRAKGARTSSAAAVARAVGGREPSRRRSFDAAAQAGH
jgi:hypothetical protein